MRSEYLIQSGPCAPERSGDCVLTANLRRFSSCSRYGVSEFTEYDTSDQLFRRFIRPEFYPNGNCEKNEGYVSILFYGCEIDSYFSCIEFSCTVAVVDAAGNKRFMQSFGYVYDESNSPRRLETVFGLSRYLKRETLCNNPAELLPGDCLTIKIEVDYCIHRTAAWSAVDQAIKNDGAKHYICLDSSFGQELCKVCDFFRCASVTDMKEKETRRVYFPNEEAKAFHLLGYITWGVKEIFIISAADICRLYVVADKYNIPTIIETCRQMIKSFLCRINDPDIVEETVENIPKFLELAKTYKDENLEESVAVYLENKKKFETNEYAFEEHVKKKLNTDWVCKYDFSIPKFFKLSRLKSKECEMEFYK